MSTDTTGGHDREAASGTTAEEILATPMHTRELGKELSARPRRGISTSTRILLAVVLLAIGFVGGLLVGRNTGSSQTVAAPGGLPGSFPTPSGGGVGGMPDGFAAGTVTRVDGNTLYVKSQDGREIEVQTTGDTQITVSEDAELADLAKGSTVVVQGTTSDDGTLEATRISEGDVGMGGEPGGGAPSGG